jgi:hypothetical protein
MTDHKPTVFITHATAESRLADVLKKTLTDSLGSAAVFVSSDGESIWPGDRWFVSVAHHLETCVAQVILCSPGAVARPWVNFEAGAGWARKIPVIPACYAGVTARMLPDQFQQFEAVDIATIKGVESLVRSVAKAAQLNPIRVRPNALLKAVKETEALQSAGKQAFPKVYDVSADIHADLPTFIRAAKESMVFSGIHFNVSLNDRMVDYVKALEAGVSLTMCSVKAGSPAVELLAGYLGIPGLSRECEITAHYYDILVERYRQLKHSPSKPVGRLSLRFAISAPLARSYAFDTTAPHGKILYVPYLRHRDSTQSPSFLFEASNPVF